MSELIIACGITFLLVAFGVLLLAIAFDGVRKDKRK